jgi:hypothetical protein
MVKGGVDVICQMQYEQDHAQAKDAGISSSFDCWSAFFELLIVTCS